MVDRARRWEKRPKDMRVRAARLQPPGQLRGRARSAQVASGWDPSRSRVNSSRGSRSAMRRRVIRSGIRSHAPAIPRRRLPGLLLGQQARAGSVAAEATWALGHLDGRQRSASRNAGDRCRLHRTDQLRTRPPGVRTGAASAVSSAASPISLLGQPGRRSSGTVGAAHAHGRRRTRWARAPLDGFCVG